MSLILSIYSREAFKEFNLPSINNSDYEITILKEQFKLSEDLELTLEVMNGVWKIKERPSYSLIVGKDRYSEVELSDPLMVGINTFRGDLLSMIVSDTDSPFHAMAKYRINNVDRITIGRDPGNDIVYDFEKMVARHHAEIRRNGADVYISNMSENGIYVNSSKKQGSVRLEFGDYINIVGLHMVYLGSLLAIDTGKSSVKVNEQKLRKLAMPPRRLKPALRSNKAISPGKKVYRRAPRYIESIRQEKIDIEAPPQMPQEKNQSLFMAIGPALTMSLPMLLGCSLMIMSYRNMDMGPGNKTGANLFMYSGLVMALSSAIVGVIWTLVNRKETKKELAALKDLRLSKYGEYLIKKSDEIRRVYDETTQSLHENYPAAQPCLHYDENSGELWSRNVSHRDFLVHRLGIGNTPFTMEINIPANRFSLYEDDLAERPELIKNRYSILNNVPITVDLCRHHIIGIVGGEMKRGAIDIARVLSAQIAANNCYTDVKLAYLYDESSSSDNGEWEFAKWLPHVWSEDKRTRYVASNRDEAGDVLYELGNVMRIRAEESGDKRKEGIPKPYFILFISDQSLIEGEMFSKYIFEDNPAFGLTTVILAERYEELPNNCEFIIENTEAFRGYYETTSDSDPEKPIMFDQVSREELEIFARRVSKLQVLEIESGGEIPNSLTFFDMMGIKKPEDLPVAELWAKSRTYENIKGLIGQKAGGAPCYLDVHEKYHGPHGLIAGTTGSGKSETLQTYILSLAINYSPYDVTFFIIDYKGGGMANLFEGMPHMAGSISNLSGNQVKRAMISIKSENRRRQRIFTENGVNNINAYTKLYKDGEATEPIPHLFIIIDEFAELKREEPDFMRELISVAQVGRSLGVHLILATQKPSGTVDDNIWSNSKFRLCLRVQDRQDSNDMLHKPDAAYITQAGRCYLQVGNDELYELFQSGYSGAAYDPSTYEGNAEVAKLISLTGKVEMTGNSIKQARKKSAEMAWAEKLIDMLEQAASVVLSESDGSLSDPDNSQKVIDSMYDIMARSGIDYPESKYNSARLQDLIRMYAELSADGDFPDAEGLIECSHSTDRKLPQQKDHTELDAVKDYLAVVARENGYTYRRQLWKPVLRDRIFLDEFPAYKENAFSTNGKWKPADSIWNLTITIGQMDDPENQDQMPFELDFAQDGNLAVAGSIVSGKSTLMQTIAFSLIQRYSPEVVNIYAIDFSSKMMSSFENAPHVGGVMYETDGEKINKFFNMINTILEERKKLFRGGSYEQYVRVNGVTLPAIFVMIDNYGAFKQKTGEKYEDDLIKLSKEGISNGIFMIVSGGGYSSSEITSRVGENMSTVLTLALKDKFEYGDLLHTMQISVLPESGVKGRGLAYYGKRILEYQAALAVEADNDYKRMEKISSICESMAEAWTGRVARPVPEIPEKPVYEEFCKLDEYNDMIADPEYLPIGYDADNASVYGIPLRETFCYGIYGAKNTGKTNLLRMCILAALKKKGEIIIVDNEEKDLGMFAEAEGITYIQDLDGLEKYIAKMTPEFQRRKARKVALLAEGKEPEELFDFMSREFKPLFFFLHEINQFINTIYKSEKDLDGVFENMLEKAGGNNIYFIGDQDLGKLFGIMEINAFKFFHEHKKGIQMGGNTEDNKLLDFRYIDYRERGRSLRAGIGQLPDVTDDNETSSVVVPLVKRRDIESL